jgi:hypothetical protein
VTRWPDEDNPRKELIPALQQEQDKKEIRQIICQRGVGREQRDWSKAMLAANAVLGIVIKPQGLCEYHHDRHEDYHDMNE